MNNFQLLGRTWFYLNRKRKIQFILLFILMFFGGFAEAISLGAVLPFIGILTAPESIVENPLVKQFSDLINISQPDELVLPLTIVFVIAAIVAGVLRLLVLYSTTRFAMATTHDIGVEVYTKTLYQSYSTHISRNSSEIVSAISLKVKDYQGCLQYILVLGNSIILILIICAVLAAINLAITLGTLAIIATLYGTIMYFSTARLRSHSVTVADRRNAIVKTLQEGLGGIRDALISSTQKTFIDVFRRADMELQESAASSYVIANSPKPFLEMLGVVLIALLAYFLSLQVGGLGPSLPVLAALLVGAQRLLPAAQQAYASTSFLRYGSSSIEDVLTLLDQKVAIETTKQSSVNAMQFSESINFESVRFRYANNEPWVLEDINLTIPKNSIVGIIGETGSGKSTLLDMLMGLLIPSEGRIIIDDIPLMSDQIHSWQKNIAHVPQNIFLSDATILENIAFGVERDLIDIDRVRKAASQAHIDQFIEEQPAEYNTKIGERGVKLSGGQRQRIGIARALYRDSTVLVLDEATSALDNKTERLVINSLSDSNLSITLVMIAHRLTTLSNCDMILELSQGKIIRKGSYEEITSTLEHS